MFLKLEEVAEERQTAVRCDVAKRKSVLPATTQLLDDALQVQYQFSVLLTCSTANSFGGTTME